MSEAEVTFSVEQDKSARVHFTIELSEAFIKEQGGSVAVAVATRQIAEAILKHAARLNGRPEESTLLAATRSLVENSKTFRKPTPPIPAPE